MSDERLIVKLKRYQWSIYVLIVIAYMATPFQRMAPAIMGVELIKDLGLSAAQFGFLGLTFFWTFALANAPVGSLVDRFGSRNSLVISLLLVATGCFIFSIAQDMVIVVIGRMIVAIAIAGCYIAGVKIISSWFTTKQFSSIYGLYMGLGAIGGVGATAPLQYMMSSYGWRSSFVIIAVGTLVLAVLSYLVVRSRPADVGLPTPNEIYGQVTPLTKPTAKSNNWWKSTIEVLKMPRIWLIGLYCIGANASGQVIVALWGGIFLSNVYGFSKPVVTEMLTIAAVGLIFGSIVAGWISKKIGDAGVMVSGSLIFLLAWLYMAIYIRTLSILELKILYAIIGFIQMYAVVAGFSLCQKIVPTAQLGTAVGLIMTVTWIFGAGSFQQIWGLIISSISKGITPYPVQAFETAIWVQLSTLVISFLCSIYFYKSLTKSSSTMIDSKS